jgi:hypothetical protein
MVGKGIISQRRLEPSENFAIKPHNPTKLLRILGDLKGITKLSTKVEFSCVQMW